MTNQHPITPPPELVEQWTALANEEDGCKVWNAIATQAAQWGADQELEACCALMDDWGLDGTDLRFARRPKPPSLKEQALSDFDHLMCELIGTERYKDRITTVRRALEVLDD